MKSGCKKLFSLCIILVFLISLVNPSYQVGSMQETTESILSCRNLLCLEHFCSVKKWSLLSEGVTRHMLQSVRRHNPKVFSLGLQIETKDEMRFIKVVNYSFAGFVFQTVLMTIIIYIFRTDGKKRIFVNN